MLASYSKDVVFRFFFLSGSIGALIPICYEQMIKMIASNRNQEN